MRVREYDCEGGRLLVAGHWGRLCLCDWMEAERAEKTLQRISRFLPQGPGVGDDEEVLQRAIGQLDEYFAGVRKEFDLPLLMPGTAFQLRVWEALRAIPYGKISIYKAVAKAVECPKAARAVAGAIGANPLSIIIPCHRVNGSDGSLTGYAGGLPAKQFLLQLEASMTKNL